MSDVKRSSRGGRRKRNQKADSHRETEPADEPAISEITAADIESSSRPSIQAQGDAMTEEREVPATDDTTEESHSHARDAEDSSPHSDERDDDRRRYEDEDEDDLDEERVARGSRDAEDPDDDYDRDEDRGRGERSEARGRDREWNERGGRREGRDRDRDRERDRDSHNRRGGEKGMPGDEYTLQVRYDRNNRQYLATVVEFPELKATGATKEGVVHDIADRVEDHLSTLRRDGRKIPEPIQSRRYPERLDVRVSQNLQRRLDILSRTEKVGLDQLVTELLTSALDRKGEQSSRQERHDNRGNRAQGGNQQRHTQHGRRAGRNFHETMDNRENFMEYVRNLEKGNFKKR